MDKKHSGFATAAFYMAMASILPILGFLFFIMSLIFGFWALDDIKREHLTGKVMAVTAIGLSMFLTIVNIAMICIVAQRSNIDLVHYRQLIEQIKVAHKQAK